ncbi:MAG: hypothetical protein JO358_19070 [Alphaproteobacteria bacterium]|nr:hypothetical protein [Alphaproteobacteria bacterium]
MTSCDSKTRATIIAAALALGCAAPHPAMAQATNSLPDGPVRCDAFQRVGNGSWTVLRPATLYQNGQTLNLPPGQTFAPNQMYEGFEVTAILDRNCGNR